MDGKWLTASVLFCLHRRGMSHTCINIPFRLAITTAAKTDCQERQGRLSYSGEWFSMWWLLNPLLFLRWQSSEGEVCNRCGEKQGYTFCKGSKNFPRATMAIITIPAEMMPATWKTYVSHNRVRPAPSGRVLAGHMRARACSWAHVTLPNFPPSAQYCWDKWELFAKTIYLVAMAEKLKKMWTLSLLE